MEPGFVATVHKHYLPDRQHGGAVGTLAVVDDRRAAGGSPRSSVLAVWTSAADEPGLVGSPVRLPRTSKRPELKIGGSRRRLGGHRQLPESPQHRRAGDQAGNACELSRQIPAPSLEMS